MLKTRAQTGTETQSHGPTISIAVAYSPPCRWKQIESHAETPAEKHILVPNDHVGDVQVLV